MTKLSRIHYFASVKQKVAHFNQLAGDQNATVSSPKAVALSNTMQTPRTSGSGKTASSLIEADRVTSLLKKFTGSARQLDKDALGSLHLKLQATANKADLLTEKFKQVDSTQRAIEELMAFRTECLSTVRAELRKLHISGLEALVPDSTNGSQRVITRDTLALVNDNLNAFFSIGLSTIDVAANETVLTSEQQEKILKESGVVVHKDDQINRRNSFELMLECVKADANFKDLAFLIDRFGGNRGCFATMQRNFFGFSDQQEDFSQWNSNLSFNENVFNLAMSLEDKSSATAVYHGLMDANGLIGNEKSSIEGDTEVKKVIKLKDIISFFAFESNNYCTIEGYEDFFATRAQEREQFIAEGGSFD